MSNLVDLKSKIMKMSVNRGNWHISAIEWAPIEFNYSKHDNNYKLFVCLCGHRCDAIVRFSNALSSHKRKTPVEIAISPGCAVRLGLLYREDIKDWLIKQDLEIPFNLKILLTKPHVAKIKLHKRAESIKRVLLKSAKNVFESRGKLYAKLADPAFAESTSSKYKSVRGVVKNKMLIVLDGK